MSYLAQLTVVIEVLHGHMNDVCLKCWLQFRLAYVAPESRVVGTGDFVVEPKKVAIHYLRGYFLLDLFVALPLPQALFSISII